MVPQHLKRSGESKEYPKRPRYGLRKVQKLAHFGPKWRKIGKGQNFGLFLVFSSYRIHGEDLVWENPIGTFRN